MVSVIITTYGANLKLIRAIDSVLQQTYEDIEVIVIDDNDPNSNARRQTEQMMTRFAADDHVKYIKHPENKNGAAARNTGIEIAKGEYIAFLDDDDFYLPERVRISVNYLNTHPNISGVCLEVARINKKYIVDVMQVQNGHILTNEDILIGKAIGSGSNIFLRRDAIQEVQGFDVSFKRKQDIEFILRVVRICKVVYLHDIQIVKDVSGVRKLSYENNRSAFIKFNSKFQNEIDSLSDNNKNTYYTTNYQFLYNIACMTGKRSLIISAAQELSQYDHTGVKKVREAGVTAIKYKMMNLSDNGLGSNLLSFLKMKRYAAMQERILVQIGDNKRSQIVKALEKEL